MYSNTQEHSDRKRVQEQMFLILSVTPQFFRSTLDLRCTSLRHLGGCLHYHDKHIKSALLPAQKLHHHDQHKESCKEQQQSD
jgi:hypothetical protein